MKAVRIIVSGKVQGVFFRDNAKRIADNLELKGYCKNLPDGTFEVVAEGPEDKLQKMVDYCKEGPMFAKVEKVSVNDAEVTGYQSFKIEH